MTESPSILKRAYAAASLFAILNVLAIGGLTGFLVSSGAFTVEKLQNIVAIMRGEELPNVASADDGKTLASAMDGQAVQQSSASPISGLDMEILRIESDRVKAELAQRLALNNSILLRMTKEKERFQREQEEAAEKQRLIEERRREDGFVKQVAIYESLKPKVAVDHLLSLPEVDDAARLLIELDARRAKKIIEAAKTKPQIQKMKLILQRLREVAPDRSAELADGNG